ncbi:MAG: CotH kinase family protein [Fibrobacterales bacterium]
MHQSVLISVLFLTVFIITISSCSTFEGVSIDSSSEATIEEVSAESSIETISSDQSSNDAMSSVNKPNSSEGTGKSSNTESSQHGTENDNTSSQDHSTTSSDTNETTSDGTSDLTLNEKLDYIFDETGPVKTYSIIIDEAALARLDANPVDEIYESAHLIFEGDTIHNIEMRYKGSFGSWMGCVEGFEDEDRVAGEKKCVKLALKLKFNTDDDPDRKFYGVKKLLFHHMVHYKDQMRERLAYWMHRAMGNPASRVVHSKVIINGELIGLYAQVEYIDGRFTRARFEDGTGNLFKEYMPAMYNKVSTPDTLMENLRTNEDENPSFDLMTAFESAIVDNKNNPMGIQQAIQNYMDVPQLVNTLITSGAAGHFDSPFFGYMGKNAYTYCDPSQQNIHFIPWDMDDAHFEPLGSWNTHNQVIQGIQCNSDTHTGRLSQNWLCFPEEALAGLNKLIDEVFPQIDGKLDAWEEQITEAHNEVRESQPGTFPETGALTYEEWQSALDEFRSTVNTSLESVKEWREVAVEAMEP